MRKFLLLLTLCLLAVFGTACAPEQAAPAAPPVAVAEAQPAATVQPEDEPVPEEDGDMIVIKEKMFIAQCNDIMFNPEDYVGKTVKVEGMYEEFVGSTSGVTYHYVNRNSPGCCGDDGKIGFEFLYDGEAPAVNDWIEVVGKLEYVEQGGVKFLVIRAEELNILAERGAEFVYN